MDVRALPLTTDDWAGHATPAWLIVLPADPKTWRPGGAIADLAHDAVRHGDLELKGGKQLYLHRPLGLKAQRLVFAVVNDLGAKAWRSAVAAGLAALKNSGASGV
ncbi:MAG: hypothetical protein RLZZ524_1100, partial [Pseudomonadota bacterium]